MAGLEAAGKTTILFERKLGEMVTAIATVLTWRWSTRTLASPCETSGARTRFALCGIITTRG